MTVKEMLDNWKAETNDSTTTEWREELTEEEAEVVELLDDKYEESIQKMCSGTLKKKLSKENHADFKQEFYTVDEAAELLRVHRNTIYTMVKNRKINYYKVGVQIRIAASELEKLKVRAE